MATAGSKRLVVGAHYGVFQYLAQRVTAVVIALYMIGLSLAVLAAPSPMQYEDWARLFTWTLLGIPLGKLLAVLMVLSLCYHAWIGMRDIWMDYVKPVGVRLVVMALTVLWLVGSAVYAVQILSKV